MLKEIKKVSCWQGLQAAFELQKKFALWLCDPAKGASDVTEENIQSLHSDTNVQSWLWKKFLLPRVDKDRLLKAAKLVISHSESEKKVLRDWIETVSQVSLQFSLSPPVWISDQPDVANWKDFKELMLAFYERLKSSSLPFDDMGNPTSENGITYDFFVTEFKKVHAPADSCVICGDRLNKIQVDHWIAEAFFPLLSIAPDNLFPVCDECNEAPGKGQKKVFTSSNPQAFEDWFHPFYYSAYSLIQIKYSLHGLNSLHNLKVFPHPISPSDALRTKNLDELVQLSIRWTREFKRKYGVKQRSLRQLIEHGRVPLTFEGIREQLQKWEIELVSGTENYELHRVLMQCLQEPERISAWHQELTQQLAA